MRLWEWIAGKDIVIAAVITLGVCGLYDQTLDIKSYSRPLGRNPAGPKFSDNVISVANSLKKQFF